MKVKIFILCLSLGWVFTPLGFSKNINVKSPSVLAPLNKRYPLIPGIYFKVLKKWKNPKITWFWIHNNEYDAKANTLWAYKNLGGTSLLLINRSYKFDRNLAFYIKNKGRFLLDPNRMFHIKGIEDNLIMLNPNKINNENLKPIATYTWKYIGSKASKILKKYWSKKQPLIALHNNRYLSIKKYRDNPNFMVAEFNSNPTGTFVFVTQKQDYKNLKKCGVNTIYQLKSEQDGSLSDYALEHKLPYINVETKINHPQEQKKVILKIAYSIYPKLFKKNLLLKKNPCEV